MTGWSPVHRGRDERGAVIMLITLAVTVLFSMAAIVVDLGHAYVTARQMQNASDAAAMAGARTLDRMHLAGASATSTAANVDATVRRIAGRNGAQASLVTCTWIDWDGTRLTPCSDATHAGTADGVEVSSGAVNAADFAQVLGVDQLRLDRMAAATIQPLVGQDAPLLVCAFDQANAPDLLVPPSGPTYSINPLAVGHIYSAHGHDIADCKLKSNAWKGVAGVGPFELPGWLPIATGMKAGPTRAQIAGQPGCGANLDALGCVLVLPICSEGNGMPGIQGQLKCQRWGAFKLVAKTSNSHDFELLGAAEAIVGVGGNGSAGQDDVRLVRLIR